MVCIGVPYGTSLWQVADSKEQNGSYKIALAKYKKDVVHKRLNLMMDKPGIVATDIIPMVNYAWGQSFVRVDKNLKAIADRGWGPLNYCLLMNPQIQATMTKSESESFALMMKKSTTSDSSSNQYTTINTGSFTTISTVTNDPAIIEMNYDPSYLQKEVPSTVVTFSSKLNFSSGRSAAVIETLLHDLDLKKAREENKKKVEKGKELQAKTDDVRKISAMLNFNTIGCEVGKDSLAIRMKMASKKKEEENKQQQKKHAKWIQQKKKFDEIISMNLPFDKLSIGQLKLLCSYKKLKTDKVCISKLKRLELLPLWLSWKDRPEVHRADALEEEAATMIPSVPVPVDDDCNGTGTRTTHDSVMIDNHQTESEEIMNVTIV